MVKSTTEIKRAVVLMPLAAAAALYEPPIENI
jgi:hypothetical protein